MGNVGNERRMQFSITGNVVISAARIEQANKECGSSFLVSQQVMDALIESPEVIAEYDVKLKGRTGSQRLLQLG
jgi:adenylate cyclase